MNTEDRQVETLTILKTMFKGDRIADAGDVRGMEDGSAAVWVQPPGTKGLMAAMLLEVRRDGSLRELV